MRLRIIPPSRAPSRLAIALVAAVAGFCTQTCQAGSLKPEELVILGRALSFMEPPLTGQIVVAIVYAAGNDTSRRDAEELAGQIGVIRVAGLPATAIVISSDLLAVAGFQLIITATGVDSEPVIEAARAHRALCVTADVEAVHDGHCTMAIRSSRKVEIFINRDAAIQSGVDFATAFRMMVHEQ